MSERVDWDSIVAAAFRVRERAYAPYSHYRVGAALVSEAGEIYVGCNVENASYGLCLCAERAAVGAAIAGGARRFSAIAIATGGTEPGSPCGMCRQVLSEFAPAFAVRCVSESGAVIDTTTEALLPLAFGPASLGVEPDGDPLRSTMIMGTPAERLETDRPPPAIDVARTQPAGRAFAGVALKVAAGTGSELARSLATHVEGGEDPDQDGGEP